MGEEEEDHKNNGSLYSLPPPSTHPLFPTVLELLDCDSPWLKSFLVEKAGIDKILGVPKFEEATSHIENISNEFTLAGVDDTGAVCHLQCGEIVQYEGATVGEVEYPASNYHGEGYKVHYWNGRDIRDRWPLFAQRLREIVSCEQEESGETREDEYVWDSDDDYSQVDSDASCTDESVKLDNSDLGIGQNLSESEENLSTNGKVKAAPNYDFKGDHNGLFIVRNEAERCKDENVTDCIDELQTSDLAVSPDLSENEKDVAGNDDNNAGVIISGSSEDKACSDNIASSKRDMSQNDEQQRIFMVEDEDCNKNEN